MVTRAAVGAGVLSCAGRIHQAAKFLTAGSQGTGAMLSVPAVDPDRKRVPAFLVISKANVPTAYVSASFAPDQANGGGASDDSVVYWPLSY